MGLNRLPSVFHCIITSTSAAEGNEFEGDAIL